MFEILTKLNIIFSLFKFAKENKIISSTLILLIVSFYFFYKGISIYNDNSIYLNTSKENSIKKDVISFLQKCGDKHAMGILAISTDTKTDYEGKFKQFMACDYLINKENCIVDLTTSNFDYLGQKPLDSATFDLFKRLANQDEVEKIYLPEFDLDDFQVLKETLEKSPHYQNKEMKYLFLTAINNREENLIYAVSLTSWALEPCSNAKYHLEKFKNKLPLTL